MRKSEVFPGGPADANSSYGTFLRGLVDSPRGVSALTPSSPALAAAIAAEVDTNCPGLVVELGPGTGAVTEALVARGLGPRLIAIEQDGPFAAAVAARFPGIQVHQGDGVLFERYLPPQAAVAAIVSGLPLLHFSPSLRRDLIRRALGRLQSGGIFLQLSYGWRPPAPPENGARLEKRLVWRNLPPAHLWIYRASNT